ncbi:MAG: MotA/TolQ/ExbB proton channel family protein [Pirellulales bacterium]
MRCSSGAAMRWGVWLVVGAALAVIWPSVGRLAAQAPGDAAGPTDREIDERIDRVIAGVEQRSNDEPKSEDAKKTDAQEEQQSLNPVKLARQGGWLMIPIVALSVVVVLVSIERALALRRSRVMPDEFIAALGQLSAGEDRFDPRKAYRVCQQYPSSAANVIRAMLLKVGRPHTEVEHAVSEASDREATILYGNVRWLTLSAAISPLLGLLGTVQGMIMAFFFTAKAEVGQNKATMLAEGIYTALVTTFAGLCVAIPAIVVAHWFEGRIQSLFRGVDDLAGTLLPHVERYEGKLRTNAKSLAADAKPVEATVVEKARG